MNCLRATLAVLIIWVGALAILYEPARLTYIVVGAGVQVLALALLLEARIREGVPRQVLVAGIGSSVGVVVGVVVLAVLGGLPSRGGVVASGTFVRTFGLALLVLPLLRLGP